MNRVEYIDLEPVVVKTPKFGHILLRAEWITNWIYNLYLDHDQAWATPIKGKVCLLIGVMQTARRAGRPYEHCLVVYDGCVFVLPYVKCTDLVSL